MGASSRVACIFIATLEVRVGDTKAGQCGISSDYEQELLTKMAENVTESLTDCGVANIDDFTLAHRQTLQMLLHAGPQALLFVDKGGGVGIGSPPGELCTAFLGNVQPWNSNQIATQTLDLHLCVSPSL